MDYIIPVNIGHGVVNVGDLPIPFDIVLNASALVVLNYFCLFKGFVEGVNYCPSGRNI